MATQNLSYWTSLDIYRTLFARFWTIFECLRGPREVRARSHEVCARFMRGPLGGVWGSFGDVGGSSQTPYLSVSGHVIPIFTNDASLKLPIQIPKHYSFPVLKKKNRMFLLDFHYFRHSLAKNHPNLLFDFLLMISKIPPFNRKGF